MKGRGFRVEFLLLCRAKVHKDRLFNLNLPTLSCILPAVSIGKNQRNGSFTMPGSHFHVYVNWLELFCSKSCFSKKKKTNPKTGAVPTKFRYRKKGFNEREASLHTGAVFSLMEVCTCQNSTLSDRFHVTHNCHQRNDTLPREVEEKTAGCCSECDNR